MEPSAAFNAYETAALSDYVLPDSSYLERFSWPFTGYPTTKTKAENPTGYKDDPY